MAYLLELLGEHAMICTGYVNKSKIDAEKFDVYWSSAIALLVTFSIISPCALWGPLSRWGRQNRTPSFHSHPLAPISHQALPEVKTKLIYEPRHEKKTSFAYAKTKTQISFAGQRLCFRYIASTIPLLPKYKISSVAVQSGLCRTW